MSMKVRKASFFAAVLVMTAFASIAQAAPVSFVLEYSRIAGPSGSATAIAVIDDSLFLNGGVAEPVMRNTSIDGFPELSFFELTITDTGFIDGVYTRNDLTVTINFDAPLDPTQELLAQDTGIGPGGDFDFNLSDNNLIMGVDVNTFEAVIRDPSGAILEQARFRLVSMTPVPLPAAAPLLLFACMTLGFTWRRRT